MKIQKTALAKLLAVGVAGASSVATLPAFAADTIDFTAMLAVVSATAVIGAIVSMGVVKLGPNFARWAVNKVAGFFR